jgi:hypothetical protein
MCVSRAQPWNALPNPPTPTPQAKAAAAAAAEIMAKATRAQARGRIPVVAGFYNPEDAREDGAGAIAEGDGEEVRLTESN